MVPFVAFGLRDEAVSLSPAKGAAMMLFLGLCVLIGTLIMVVGGVKFPFLPW
jgi:hypothetical protein